ncbi:hypothetical protein PBI_IRONMAN_79 [Mycobacterium phage IronMan]|uniref:RDF protein n=1 Tax=Mycobacterium phage IronMan TaxID=2499042 RepID=A0A3S9UD92_9CAUD|nr:site-specific recombination directionality factor RDF [Mycobacterium phage IronMan]AZS08280.1 hypothetical protein PBI_IRONMAN_79 [Mycobacterium phage IronMan]
MRRLLLTLVLLGMLSIGILQVGPAPAHAEVSAQCWAHLAEIPPGETPAGDVRYHRLKGEFSPCTEQEASEASQAASNGGGEKRDHDKKSRYCKKRWFC